MAQHLRFKRHLRFLREGEVVRVITDLESTTSLPAGEAFDLLLDALMDGPNEEGLRADLALSMKVDAGMVDALIARLFELELIERFDPEQTDIERFDRQLLLFDTLDPVTDHAENITRQRRLQDAHILILGLGGIGHQIALSLAAAGVGTLILVDGDAVEESNLHRQILFSANDTGRTKVDAARDGILRIAPACNVITRRAMIHSEEEWRSLIAAFPEVRHVMLSADKPVQLVNWLSNARKAFNYHFIKCGYMTTQGLIGPLLGPGTRGYDELFSSWGALVDAQPENITTFNAQSTAPTMAASNAIMANIAVLELIKHITGVDPTSLLEKRLLLDLRYYATHFG